MSAVARGRAAARRRMTSLCTIRRKSLEPTQDEATGQVSYPWDVLGEDVPLRLSDGSARAGQSRAQNVGGVDVEVPMRVAHLPYDIDARLTFSLADGDRIEITDGEYAGLVLRVIEAVGGDQQTARRVPVTVAAKEW